MKNWNIEEVPSQPGKVAIVTGANSGIGYPTRVKVDEYSNDKEVAQHLWQASQEMTNVFYLNENIKARNFKQNQQCLNCNILVHKKNRSHQQAIELLS